jgi:hypothetical protein
MKPYEHGRRPAVSSKPIVSLVIETNLGGVAVTVCGCGVLVLHSMASDHIEVCQTMVEHERLRAELEADRG